MPHPTDTLILNNKIVITPLLKAQQAFHEALATAKSQLEKDGAIQRFEFSFELAWKTMKRVLKEQGVIVNNPRDTFRLAAQNGMIDNPNDWFQFLDDRNRTTHIYEKLVADEIFSHLAGFGLALDALIAYLVTL